MCRTLDVANVRDQRRVEDIQADRGGCAARLRVANADAAKSAVGGRGVTTKPGSITVPPRYANGPTARYMTHMFDMRCCENGIEHRFTKISHPWTNGQVERMNRTIKDATVKRFHYDSHEQLRRHLQNFIDAYNFGRRLKTLKGLTPYEFICKRWTSQPDQFIIDPIHQIPGLNT